MLQSNLTLNIGLIVVLITMYIDAPFRNYLSKYLNETPLLYIDAIFRNYLIAKYLNKTPLLYIDAPLRNYLSKYLNETPLLYIGALIYLLLKPCSFSKLLIQILERDPEISLLIIRCCEYLAD